MKQFYELIEDVRNIIAEKFVSNYRLGSVYRAVMYAFIYAALQRKLGKYELLKPLEEKAPLPLLVAARRELVDRLYSLLIHIDTVLSTNKPVLAYGEADLRYTVEAVKHEIGDVDYVLVYDCMSLIEQLVISAFLKVKGVRSVFLNVVFLNPIGLTRFVTQQLCNTKYRTSLLGVAQYVANKLNALLYTKNSFIDEKVHEVGLLGVDEFVDKIAIDRIANEILEKASKGRVLVFSDHGYDVIASPHENYLYIVHGFRQESRFGEVLLLLSRITPFMGAYGVG